MTNSSILVKSVRYQTREIKLQDSESVTDRQERVQGFKQEVIDNLKVLQIGAGGLGGEISQGLVKKGIRQLKLFDGDTVDVSNLSRQFFYEEDLYKNKAFCLAKNLVKEGTKKTDIIAYPYMFQKAIEEKIDIKADVVVCAPDNDEVRIFTSQYYYKTTPVIFTGLDLQANTGYVFVQQSKEACFGCAFPQALKKKEPCPNTPAVIDLVKIIAGLMLFAIDATVCERKRSWNYRQLFLAGFAQDIAREVEKKTDCSICG